MPEILMLWPGDVVFTRGDTLLGFAIRRFTRDAGEAPTKVNHVGVITEPGTIHHAQLVEALQRVEKHTPYDKYGRSEKQEVAVFRPRLTQPQVDLIVAYAEAQVGKKYGYHKIALQALRRTRFGGFIDKWWKRGSLDRYPICSYLVARAFGKAGLDFGVHENLATPDDMWDFCQSRPDKYELIFPLGPLVR